MQKKQISTNRPNSDAIKVDIVLLNVEIGGKEKRTNWFNGLKLARYEVQRQK